MLDSGCRKAIVAAADIKFQRFKNPKKSEFCTSFKIQYTDTSHVHRPISFVTVLLYHVTGTIISKRLFISP